jgi:hypothetical protein
MSKVVYALHNAHIFLYFSHDLTRQRQLLLWWIIARTETEKETGRLMSPIVEKNVFQRKLVPWIIGESLVKVERRNLSREAEMATQIAIVAAANPAMCGLHVCLVSFILLFQR